MPEINCTLKLMVPTDPNVRVTNVEPCAKWNLTLPVSMNTNAHMVHLFVENLLRMYFNLNDNTFTLSCAPELIVWERDNPYILNRYDYTHINYILSSFSGHDMYSEEQVITIAMNNIEHRAIIEDVLNNPNVGPINYWYPIDEGALHFRITQIRQAQENNNIDENNRTEVLPTTIALPASEDLAVGECPVCMETNSLVSNFNCTHGICDSCYTSWSEERQNTGLSITCPMCRASVSNSRRENNNIQNNDIQNTNNIHIATNLIDRLRSNINRIEDYINNANLDELNNIANSDRVINMQVDYLELLTTDMPNLD